MKNLHDFDMIHGGLRAVRDVLSRHLFQSFIQFQSNILLSDGHCYLTDFGMHEVPTDSETKSASFDTIAQMLHMGWAAPELDQQPRSKQSDIFSFACTIYEVLVYILDLSSLFTYLCS